MENHYKYGQEVPIKNINYQIQARFKNETILDLTAKYSELHQKLH